MDRLKIIISFLIYTVCSFSICNAHTIEGTYHHKKLAVKQIELVQTYFQEVHNLKPLENLKVYIVGSCQEFKETIKKHCPKDDYDSLVNYAGALSFGKVIIIDSEGLEDKHVKYYLTHEITHVYQLYYCGSKYLTDNLWYSEGVSDLIAEKLSGFSYLKRQKKLSITHLISTKAFREAIEKHGSAKIYASCITTVEFLGNPIEKYFAKEKQKWYPI